MKKIFILIFVAFVSIGIFCVHYFSKDYALGMVRFSDNIWDSYTVFDTITSLHNEDSIISIRFKNAKGKFIVEKNKIKDSRIVDVLEYYCKESRLLVAELPYNDNRIRYFYFPKKNEHASVIATPGYCGVTKHYVLMGNDSLLYYTNTNQLMNLFVDRYREQYDGFPLFLRDIMNKKILPKFQGGRPNDYCQEKYPIDKEILSFIEQYGERAMFDKYFYYDKYEKMYCVRDDAIRQKSMTISYYYTMRKKVNTGDKIGWNAKFKRRPD